MDAQFESSFYFLVETKLCCILSQVLLIYFFRRSILFKIDTITLCNTELVSRLSSISLFKRPICFPFKGFGFYFIHTWWWISMFSKMVYVMLGTFISSFHLMDYILLILFWFSFISHTGINCYIYSDCLWFRWLFIDFDKVRRKNVFCMNTQVIHEHENMRIREAAKKWKGS